MTGKVLLTKGELQYLSISACGSSSDVNFLRTAESKNPLSIFSPEASRTSTSTYLAW